MFRSYSSSCFYNGDRIEKTLNRSEKSKEAMSDPYESARGGRLAFKGGDLATRKSIEKKKKKSKSKKNKEKLDDAEIEKMAPDAATTAAAGDDIYSIDAAKKKKYDELFPVEAKKFGYVPKAELGSVAEALNDRVKKKADRYCK